ncbi:MAG: glycosyltransferase [Candidatus Competibacteraceae bacterium]|nr:glycosyltransferase [Candidatus Competibacteraceae bacterium]
METKKTDPVDIIVPVYRGLTETRRCLESILEQPQQQPYELIAIDDASPEPELTTYLDELAANQRLTLLRHAVNKGFVAAANSGLRLHLERDVVLLNSDTEVHGNWLDRLAQCAYANKRIGTVTPFSNNATICSYPYFCRDNLLPEGLTLAELDTLFRRANAGRWLEIPTAIGFCMYIRRTCLEETGYFDEQQFGFGYGEENDFCMRASQKDWRHLLCADTFVYHVGGVSFSDRAAKLQADAQTTLATLHPEYPTIIQDFIREDPVRSLRLAVDQERARFSPEQASQVVMEQHQVFADLWEEHALKTSALEKGLREAEGFLSQAWGELRERDQAIIDAQHYVREREADIASLEERCHVLQDALNQAQQNILLLQQQNQQLNERLEQIYASRSWRYTKFLRRS